MAAIEEELAAPGLSLAEAPLIEISETPAGRDTMAAIAEELRAEMRPKQNTLPYGDRISNAPGARSPSRAPAAPRPTAPVKATNGAAAAPKASAKSVPPPPSAPQLERVEIFELLTFIVRGSGVGDLSTDQHRRRFVERHLLHRVPGNSLTNVERIEVTPWTAKGTMVVRVWCRA